ncbi:MAG TPA: ubiquitin-like small modifier protein 1 [Longimicrobiales bacterium]
MAVTILLPRALLPYAEGNAEWVCDVSCTTVRDALAALAAHRPALVDRILNERGELRPHVNVFVGDEDIRYLGGLAARIDDDATVAIVPAVSGGVARPRRGSCGQARRRAVYAPPGGGRHVDFPST